MIQSTKRQKINLMPIFLYKSSWDFSQKSKCNKIISIWKMTFQASDEKGRNFLDLLDNNLNIIELIYFKRRSQLKYFSYSNSLCIKATRAITNHTLIDEYYLRFFPQENFACPYTLYPIEMRRHILHMYIRYNNYWNPKRDIIAYFIFF